MCPSYTYTYTAKVWYYDFLLSTLSRRAASVQQMLQTFLGEIAGQTLPYGSTAYGHH